MESASIRILVFCIISLIYGIALGFVTIPLSKKLTLSRTDDPGKAAPLNKAPLKIAAVCMGVTASFGIVFTIGIAGDYSLMIRNLLLLVPMFGIIFVDALVRKIPNPLLLTMIAIDVVYIIYECASTQKIEPLIKAFLGMFVGMLVCYIPSVLKIPMGAGDIKYSAVIGLTVYVMGYAQSMILMSLLDLMVWVYLKVTKKGGMKTLIPMGPLLTIGTIITMCVSIFELISPGITEFTNRLL